MPGRSSSNHRGRRGRQTDRETYESQEQDIEEDDEILVEIEQISH
jgi:hypothetical protein